MYKLISRRTGELELDESAIICSQVRELEYSPEADLAPTHVGVPELLGVVGVVPVEAADVGCPLWSGGLELAPSGGLELAPMAAGAMVT